MTRLIKTIPAFPVHKIDTAVEFYKIKFGFNCRHKEKGFAILVRNDIELHLWVSNDESWKQRGESFLKIPISSGAESFLAGTHSCRIEVKGIDDLYKELKQANVLYDKKTIIERTQWRTREFPALDLHRNLLTFYENID